MRGDRIFTRGRRLWYRVKRPDGVWVNRSTGYVVGQEAKAVVLAKRIQEELNKRAAEYATTAESDPVSEPTIAPVIDIREPLPRKLGRQTLVLPPPIPKPHPIWDGETTLGKTYMVTLWPDLKPDRIKIGFTEGSVRKRVRHYLTACPEAELIAAWYGDRGLESALLRKLPGRVMIASKRSEIFDCGDVSAAVVLADRLLGARCDDFLDA